MRRIFKQVPRALFGKNSVHRVKELIPEEYQNNILFIIDDALPNLTIENLSKGAQTIFFQACLHEPKTSQIDQICNELGSQVEKLPSAIVGIGGGSTMDVAKSVSVMLTNEGSSEKYQGWDLVTNPGVYKVGIPTISGSGAEASRTAVLMGPERKFGINSDHSMFDSILLDSTLTFSVPSDQKFYTGMDCYIHCVESLEGTMINELSKSYASKALELCRKSFLEEYNEDEMMVASFMGGVSIVNSEVGVCHALSYGLSMELGFRHGIANCIAFNVLDDYYGVYVNDFRHMVDKFEIDLPTDVCSKMNEDKMDRMVDMTLKMGRPLQNALGDKWREIMTRDKIKDLYWEM